jgi:aldehyde:ferredoxin oxidoreductase
MAATRIIDRTYMKDSLLLCDSSWPLMVSWHTSDHVGDPTLESRIFSAVTGIETDEKELNRYGERIFNLQRAVLLREGWRPKLDDVPAAFNYEDPVDTVFMNPDVIVPGPGNDVISRKGQTLDREDFDAMQKEFYELRGWDSESGRQKAQTLERLGLSDLIQELNVK